MTIPIPFPRRDRPEASELPARMTVQQLAEWWGVSDETIYRKRDLPFIRIGSGPRARRRYRREDVERYEHEHTEVA